MVKPQLWKKLFIQKSEVIPLRTSGKRLPGKKLAIYIGVVIAVLVLSFNLTRDLSFILVSDKEGVCNFICSKSLVTTCDQIRPIRVFITVLIYSSKGLYRAWKWFWRSFQFEVISHSGTGWNVWIICRNN